MTHLSSTNEDSHALHLLALGEQQLAAGEHSAAAATLREALQSRSARLAAHNLIERHGLDGAFTPWMGLNCTIAPKDDIYHFFDGHPTSTNPLRDYLADGWRTLSELLLLLEAVDKPLLRCGNFLEFASGHGRFTRHLVKAIGAERVTVSDVVTDAVDFAQHALNVKGFVSSAKPEDVAWPQRYDVVFVLSLFSHLPKSTWTRWLKALWASVAPGGVLIFSTHGVQAAQRAGVTLDEDGFFFAASSESNAIDAQEYGTAFSSAAFVRAQIVAHMGRQALVHEAPAWFWHHQDAYVLRRSA